MASGQPQVAFLTGVVELEGRLNRLVRISDPKATGTRGRPISLRILLELANRDNLLPISPMEIDRLAEARNRVAHGQALSATDLNDLTFLLTRLLDQLPEE